MNANVNNSVNANNSNINAMDVNNINDCQFVCRDCGSTHIGIQHRCHTQSEPRRVQVVFEATNEEGDSYEPAANDRILAAIARNMSQLPEGLVDALKGAGVYDSLVQMATTVHEDGYIRNPNIVKQWMVSQALKLIFKERYNGITDFLNASGYRYALKVMGDQLHAMSRMEKRGDMEALEENSMIWTDQVFIESMKFWIDELDQLKSKTHLIHRNKGRKYVKLYHKGVNRGKGVYLNEWDSFIERFSKILDEFKQAATYSKKEEAFTAFHNEVKQMVWSPDKVNHTCKAFYNAFKAAGGYFTLKDFVLYKGASITDDPTDDQVEALMNLYKSTCGEHGEKVTTEGYKMFGYLTHLVKDKLNFDFEGAKKEWWEAAQIRREENKKKERRSRN